MKLSFYNDTIEDLSTRLMYLNNTLDTYAVIAGVCSFLLLFLPVQWLTTLMFLAAAYALLKYADFYPVFLFTTPAWIFFLVFSPGFSWEVFFVILSLNVLFFIANQFLFLSLPFIIIHRDFTIPFRVFYFSFLTIAATTMSFWISVYFASFLTLVMHFKPLPTTWSGFLFWAVIAAGSVWARKKRPVTFASKPYKPAVQKPYAKRIFYLNIDGLRIDRFHEARPEFMLALQRESSYFPKGLSTVYRALTNPAFVSVLTGAPPAVHGIKDNNLGYSIKIEGLPDLVKTKLYGSMHAKHFSKPHWDIQTVSIPIHGLHGTDDVMFDLMKKDIAVSDDTRLFIADISETDLTGHMYCSTSGQYLRSIGRADERIKNFYTWLKDTGKLDDSLMVISSDHGVNYLDHSYLLADAERYVPFIITGPGIKKNNPLTFDASIMDITVTLSYLLGIRYPSHANGRVLAEILQ